MFKAIIFVILFLPCCVYAKQSNLNYIENANGDRVKKVSHLVKWTHTRFVFNRDIARVALGHETTLDVNVVNGRELLILAKKLGRTSMMVWYDDNTSETFLLGVTEDYSVLENALNDIHPNLALTIAPDRHAVVLRGEVPTLNYRHAAHEAAKNYLYASSSQSAQPVITSAPNQGMFNSLAQRLQGMGNLNNGLAQSSSKVAIINLIKVTQAPKPKEARIAQVLKSMGADKVTVKRISVDELSNDDNDVFMLSGTVKNQIELVRLLNTINKLFEPEQASQAPTSALDPNGLISSATQNETSAIEVLANESGGLLNDDSGLTLSNVNSNVARATLLSVAKGKVLSSIEVEDLPQVRVSVQLYEVNQRRLKQWRPDISVLSNGYNNEQGLFGLEGMNARESGSASIENALQLIGGQLTNNLQLSTSQFAIDMLFSLLEQEGISRTLSRPTLTVLAGESAVFKVGGEVPVPTSYSPSGVTSGQQGNSGSVFSGTEFKSFGVELNVRALVDDKDRITLDLNPVISLPDTTLTAEIAQSTGSSLNSSAFNTRSMQTSTRLQDGQPLIIGGLISTDNNASHDFVPDANGESLLGKLSETTSKSENNRELIIVVTPNLVREPVNNLRVWQTVDLDSQMASFIQEQGL
ncbi:pilus assembly protein N-terminal domain-containing protein [Pseudoalteromonas sp. CST5]|uniref:pilus assembly protein N-terminal domain-containing protein n=1 Tax=unclassified Pseudoalteromonas TaxID=194690 RepID=UPI002359B74F|nr:MULTISPECIES: pilus assembly protein N-terminal domain-containing protein [unclassified Pseudoalteromonas]MDC9511831.1 pilus assembly protein N-terminal domain-containing protein [Pseudoalteromonas sp. CST1]MDC9536067.1 pilus assembly protein N-terminal domain-containing protein [Pseudoalteromonas sp. CST3]MDC9540570.1 pilus assembly protein N-terminal domain-containing protein [Pseudoalteromonas sp. CST2]MDC9547331.1 pilus assembly protein N-terminal domain-containing protein [Pseudoalterom